MPRRTTQGFTLIELLVVISIIGLLSSVVLSSLNATRFQAKDASIRAEAKQLLTLMEYNYSDYNSYSNLSPNAGWVTKDYTCTTYPVVGTYAAEFKRLCASIMNQESGQPSSLYFYTGVNVAVPGANMSTYSIMVWLPGQQAWQCFGSSGLTSTTPTGDWSQPGCWRNP